MFSDATEALEFVVSEAVQMVDLKTVDLLVPTPPRDAPGRSPD